MLKKKRIAVITSDVPFVKGGHLIIAQSTVKALQDYGHEADLILTPQNRFGSQLRAYLATRLIDFEEDGLGRKIDQIISFRFPSFAAKHSCHVCWLNHRMREYYDLWEMLLSQLHFKGKIKENIRRRIIHFLDTFLLKHNVSRLWAQSKTIQQRLKKWGKIQAEVLYPPPPQRDYYTHSYQNFILAISRLHKLKRLDLLIEAFKYIKNKELKAVIIGQGPEENNLKQKIKMNALEKRIDLLGKADEKTILANYAQCRAVFFAPLREDYGLVTAEAFACRKPVVTTSDAGGPTELVKNKENGFIVENKPEIIAEKFDLLAEDKDLAEAMGLKAYHFISQLSWDKTVEKLIIC